MDFENFIQSGFHGPVKFPICLTISTKSDFCIKWSLIVKRYIVHVIQLRCFQTLYTVLTHWMVNFKISSTVPLYCKALLYNVTLFSIEHKKVRIRHNLLYLNTSGCWYVLSPNRKETSYCHQTRDLFNILPTKLNTLLSPLL